MSSVGLSFAGYNALASLSRFTLSIEAREGVTTGISASDRARTILTAVSKNTKPADIVHPGHIFPLKARNGGVLNRAGHTEAGVDLANLAGFEPAAVICEIIKDDGEMARKPELQDFAKEHQLKIGTVADLIHYRLKFENSLTLYDKSKVLTKYGSFELLRFQDNFSGNIHFALKKGEINPESPTLVRVQTNNTVRDLIQSVIPDTEAGWTFSKALKTIAMNEKGIIVLIHKNETIDELLHSSSMIMGKENIFEANEKDSTITVGIGSQILKESGIGKIILMAKPAHYSAISGFGLEITKFVAPKDCDTTIE